MEYILDIYSNPDKPWDWYWISSNGLNYQQRYVLEARRVLMAYRIQLHWRQCRYNPAYKMCRYLFYKRSKAICDEFGQKLILDDETKEDIGDWLARYDNN